MYVLFCRYFFQINRRHRRLYRRGPSRAGCIVKLEEIDWSIVRPEDSPHAQIDTTRGHNQIVSDVWERMLGDEGEQQEEDCYHEDEDASLGHRGVETRSH